MVRIYVVTQKEALLPDIPNFVGLNPDNASGEHIAAKTDYSELRAHYWVWKNELSSADRIGFFQFRRYLDYGNPNTKLPYSIRKSPLNNDFCKIDIIQQYDIIAPLSEFTGQTVWQRYSDKHRVDDLQLIYDIIKLYYPEYLTCADIYLNCRQEYYANLYIMKNQVLDSYFCWLFDVLERYDSMAGQTPPRTQGYLAERLFGIWLTKAKADGMYSYKEVPRVQFWCFDDATHHLRREKLVNYLLPPGSKRRVSFKRIMER